MILRIAIASAIATGLVACATGKPSIPTVASVDLPRFMGDWYVIAHIPAKQERNAYNAVESYRLEGTDRIRTTFRFREGGFDAPLKTMEPLGTVVPETHNAVWGMQFVWPIKAEYVIADLSPDYQRTLVARSKRDYLWIMARTPMISDADYDALVAKAKALGYDTGKIRKVPQQWPEMGPEPRVQP